MATLGIFSPKDWLESNQVYVYLHVFNVFFNRFISDGILTVAKARINTVLSVSHV